MISCVTTGTWNVAHVKTLNADVNVRTFQTPIAHVVRRLLTRVTSVARVKSVRIASLALLNLLQNVTQHTTVYTHI